MPTYKGYVKGANVFDLVIGIELIEWNIIEESSISHKAPYLYQNAC